ncbi:hypothetical protein ACFL6G_03000 [candidate division KSB1 bacterium]
MKLRRNIFKFILPAVFILAIVSNAAPQSPDNSFYHDKNTILPYASFLVTLPEGEVSTIPFTGVIIDQYPSGTMNFTKDIDLRGRLVFAGNGIVAPDEQLNSYSDYNLQGQIPIIVYNVPDDYKTRYGIRSDLHTRVSEAAARGAAAVIVFGIPGNTGWNSPFVSLPPTKPPIEIPVFTLSYDNAMKMLNDLGLNISRLSESRDILFSIEPIELPGVARITVNSGLKEAVSRHFQVRYLPGVLTGEMIQEYLSNRERAFNLVDQYLNLSSVDFTESEEIFFPDQTSLKYFTLIENFEPSEFGHKYRLFEAYKPGSPPLVYPPGDIVHETTFLLVSKMWGNSHPALMEGLGVMLKDIVESDNISQLDKNAADILREDKMLSIIQILTTDTYDFFKFTGNESTQLGSFIRYIYTSYGSEKYKRLYDKFKSSPSLKDRVKIINEVYFKEIRSLEYEWLEILALKHAVPSDKVDRLVLATENYLKLIDTGKIK